MLGTAWQGIGEEEFNSQYSSFIGWTTSEVLLEKDRKMWGLTNILTMTTFFLPASNGLSKQITCVWW